MAKSAQASKTNKKKSDSKVEVKSKKKSVPSKVIAKKPYIEFVTAFLSIPVLITVLLLNFNSLKNLGGGTPTPTTSPNNTSAGFFTAPVDITNATPTIALIDRESTCTKGVGPIAISSPNEGDTVTQNPVIITINYDSSTYCAVAWSYRINEGEWSGYNDRSVGLYNLPQGAVKFELRVKSIVNADEKTLTRNFTYKGTGNVMLPTPVVGTGSAR